MRNGRERKDQGFTLAEVLISTVIVIMIAINAWNVYNIAFRYLKEGIARMNLLGECSSCLMHMRYRIARTMDLNFNSPTDLQGVIEPYNMDRGSGYEPNADSAVGTNYAFRYQLVGTNLNYTTNEPGDFSETLSANVSAFSMYYPSVNEHNRVMIMLTLSRNVGGQPETVEMKAGVVSQCKNNQVN